MEPGAAPRLEETPFCVEASEHRAGIEEQGQRGQKEGSLEQVDAREEAGKEDHEEELVRLLRG